MLLLALLLAAAPSPSTNAGDTVDLSSEEQVRGLCTALRDSGEPADSDPAAVAEARKSRAAQREQALQKTYRLEVRGKGFVFGRYRSDAQLLELDGDRPLRSQGGVVSLDLDGIDDVAFRATPAQVASWSKLKGADALSLVVTFHAHPERCAGSAAAHAFRFGGAPLSWQLVDAQGAVLANANADGEPADQGPSAQRTVHVEKVALESDTDAPGDDGKSRLSSVQAALDRCAQAAPRTGAMVVSFAVQGGRIVEPQVIMDALRDETASRCVAKALTGAQLAGAANASGRGTASLALQ